jgi:beta-mannosidase
MKKIILFTCLFNSLIMFAQQKQYLHDNWQFRQADSTEWRPAMVPGSVHTDLIREGIIPDPFFNTNEKDVQWIELEYWVYKTSFTCSEDILNEEHISIIFEGLDTYAEVWLNDSLILSANNMHRAWEADVKSLLRVNNQLHITFRSPVEAGKELAKAIPFKMPVDERIYTRKAQYQYGWDWGPRLVGCGIWKDVYLKGWTEARIENLHLQQDTLSDEYAHMNLSVRWQAKPGEQYTIDWQVAGSPEAQTVLQVHSGQGAPPVLHLPFDIQQPKRWWSNGLGEAYLYTGELRILKDSVLVDSQTLRFGLRTIELVQEPDEQGKSFYFRLNGKPVFAKGANFIPTHSFPEQTTAASYRFQLQEAADAGVNMLRIWGGGIYESDIFYDICDSLGIMVWQDFMFACAMYPGDSAFLDNAIAEITYQTERLRNHPSIVLWCGNNEIDEAWHNWGWQVLFGYLQLQADQIWDWYEELFHRRIPAQLAISDPSRSYWPSSPSIGWGRREAVNQGDMHYWGVWWGKFPFRVYEHKVGRFMSEYGFQAHAIPFYYRSLY